MLEIIFLEDTGNIATLEAFEDLLNHDLDKNQQRVLGFVIKLPEKDHLSYKDAENEEVTSTAQQEETLTASYNDLERTEIMLDFFVLLCSQDGSFIKILLKRDHLTGGSQTFDEENISIVNVTRKDESHYIGQGGSQYKTLNTSSHSCTSNGNKSRQRNSALMLALRPIMMEAEDLARDR